MDFRVDGAVVEAGRLQVAAVVADRRVLAVA
jgi:hypothetical protein